MTSNDKTEQLVDYKNTLNLPNTSFPMKGDGPRREPEIQKKWYENDIYQDALKTRKSANAKSFLLHDGPPYLSSGNIHIGTALNKILKDIVVKYKTLQGFYSPYLPGFDCHGLPIETAVLKDKKEKLSTLEIRKQCTEYVLKNRALQEEKFKRLGVLGDWQNAYMTIDPKFEASQLKLFAQMVDNGYIYRGLKPVYWCSACRTALAEAEVEYVESHKSPSIYMAFSVSKLSKQANKLSKYKNLNIVIWTTTPWTLPGNLAICLNKNFQYVVVESKQYGYLIVAKDLHAQFNQKISEETVVVDKITGEELEHSVCIHPLFGRESLVILGEHVTLETGTGCVHTAPGHGLEDYFIGQKYSLDILSPVDSKGVFTDEAGEDFKGLYVHKAGNQKVIESLKSKGVLLSLEDYHHSYPYCWRSKTPILFRATQQWFCSVNDFRTKSLEAIEKVNWVPSVGKNRIYSMVENRGDWCISRQRVWGVPITAFYCTSCNKPHLNKELIEFVSKFVEKEGSSIWFKLDVKDLIPKDYKCDCGSTDFIKENDTMDVWFDSGSTHYSVINNHPELSGIDDILYLEGSDQHRGWFQSSLLTSIAISGKAPYKTVITHGFVLDENGRKMSKSLGNVVDPQTVINQYGADILRLWVASIDYSADMRIGQNMLKQLAEVYRNIRNTVRFILGNVYDFTDDLYKNYDHSRLWLIDKYIISVLENKIKKQVVEYFDKYEFYRYYQILQNFCAVELSSFYFDVIKDRLYTAPKDSHSRRSAQYTLCRLLDTLLPLLIPVLPHLAQDILDHYPSLLKKTSSNVLLFTLPSDISPKLKNASYIENIFGLRSSVNKALELARANKSIGKSLEAKVHLFFPENTDNTKQAHTLLSDINQANKSELSSFFIVSQLQIYGLGEEVKNLPNEIAKIQHELGEVIVTKADGAKCQRCWKYAVDIGSNEKHKTICKECIQAVAVLA